MLPSWRRTREGCIIISESMRARSAVRECLLDRGCSRRRLSQSQTTPNNQPGWTQPPSPKSFIHVTDAGISQIPHLQIGAVLMLRRLSDHCRFDNQKFKLMCLITGRLYGYPPVSRHWPDKTYFLNRLVRVAALIRAERRMNRPRCRVEAA